MGGEVTVKFNAIPGMLASLPQQVQEMHRESVERIAQIARQYAPVLTGALRDSITVDDSTLGVLRIVAGVDYAIWVHYGTRHMLPRPFLEWAIDNYRSSYGSDMGAIVEQIARRNGAH